MPNKQIIKLLILSDTHDIDPDAVPLSKLPPADVILHCGDITENGDPEKLDTALRLLANMPAELKLVIAGNHDATFDREWYAAQGGDVRNCDQAEDISRRYGNKGLIYLSEGTHRFVLSSGAAFSIYASPYTPVHGSCALQYPSAEDRYNPSKDERRVDWAKVSSTADLSKSAIPADIDIVMTHGPPKYILDRSPTSTTAPAVGCEHLRRAIERSRPLLHAFGHVHSGYGAARARWNKSDMEVLTSEWVEKNSAAEKGFASLSDGSAADFLDANRGEERGQTLFVNASIRDHQGLSSNMPWYVELAI